MKLEKAEIKKFKSVMESTEFEVDPNVTALVGKNESGKTVALQGIYRLNPLPSGNPENFQGLRDYPRSKFSRDRKTLGNTHPIELTFRLENPDLQALEDSFGQGVVLFDEFTVSRCYENEGLFFGGIEVDANAAAKHYLETQDIDVSKYLGDTLGDTLSKLNAAENEETVAAAKHIEESDVESEVRSSLHKMLPKFQYFDEYSILPGEVSIKRLQSVEREQLGSGERTALALLKLADVESATFNQQDYEERKAALEAAANQITDELFNYWSQNDNLEIELDIDFRSINGNPSQKEPWLQVRVRNTKHRVTLNMSERSKGFIWFFSFLVAFSEYKEDANRIILLDEPGTSLHAKAQGDLLKFIDERLAVGHQVIYTTHSLFMINPDKIERCRTVEDADRVGTTISKEIWKARSETVFPLLGALGVNMKQTLIIGPHQLLVEGPSDMIYLQLVSQVCIDKGMDGLDERWTLTPVGGLDKLPTFIALLGGSDLDVTVITDVSAGGNQKLDMLIKEGLLGSDHFIPLTEITGTKEADIEDLFDPKWYIELLEASGTVSPCPLDLHGGRIVKQVEAVHGKYDHFKPADYLLRKEAKMLDEMSDQALERFSKLFAKTNDVLPRS